MAATGTPTPNIGLRIPQGTDPVSVDDINYNSNLLDTKLGAVGNTSVQDQIDSLNDKLTAYNGDTATAGEKFSVDSRVQRSGNIVFVSIIATANSAYGSSDIVANVPSGLRPIRSIPVLLITLYRGTSVYNYAVSGSVGTDGNIYQSYTSSNGQSGDRITMLFVYTI